MLLLGRRTADEKIAAFLLGLQQRYARIGALTVHVPLPMSRQDIADYLGLTIETVSRTLTKFARDMVGIADTFARALAACPPAIRDAADPQVKAVLDGVEATDRQLVSTLERYGVKQVDTADGKFDPNLHQAIAEVPGDGKPPGSIVDVVQTGFMISDRLLRPAMVTVARKESSPANVDTKV